MNRLVVNPNRPDTWEIELKEGTNHLGRGNDTDFKIADAPVSSSHCQILVSNGEVSIQDLGSTNGTFINGAPAQAATLQNGQAIRLGNVEMIFCADAPQPAAPAEPSTPRPAPRLRVSVSSQAQTETAPAVAEIPPLLIPQFDVSAAASACKFHPKSHARWFCGKCIRSYCDLCVNTKTGGGAFKKICRSCGNECAPLEIEFVAPAEKGFLASLPGAFIYPFRGSGVLILIFSALLFAALSFRMAGIYGIIIWFVAIGYLFSYMQNIVHATANEETQMPELPGMDDLFGGFLRLAGTVAMSFGLTLGLMVARLSGVDIPVSAIIISMLIGCLYFPMAFLVVAMKDNVMACNPLVVVPSILRVPGQYLITVILLISIFGVQEIGSLISSAAGSIAFSTTSISVMFLSFGIKLVWSLIKVYLLTVNMRILGLLYLTQKEKLGWY
jgi:Inner membrane component of T3SS, cytoplasmic domain